jgi:hypothetical protein
MRVEACETYRGLCSAHGAKIMAPILPTWWVRQCAGLVFLEPTVAMSSDWFPRPPTMYARRGIRAYRGRALAQPMGREIFPYYLPSEVRRVL